MINKTLKGVVRLTGGEDYNFTLPDNPSGIQNALANIVLEEVFIECDTTLGSIGIYLPQIALFNGGWIPKIFVTSVIATTNEISILPYQGSVRPPLVAPDTINSLTEILVLGTSTAYLHIVGKKNWGAWLTVIE
ncbi:MAG: hypothetical protein WCI04_00085 [archaeon]